MLAATATHGHWNLQSFWFLLIAILWIGYFVLEGFDFGVGILQRFIGRTEEERGTLVHTIGPVWDGNEVWLIVAGGATFAAFPAWYATLFSAFYIPAVRPARRPDRPRCRDRVPRQAGRRRAGAAGWDTLLAVVERRAGAALGRRVRRLRPRHPDLDANGDVHRQPPRPARPVRAPRRAHDAGAVHVPRRALPHPSRSTAELERRARRAALTTGPIAAVLVLVFLVWTYINAVHAHEKGIVPGIIPIAAIVLPFVAGTLATARRPHRLCVHGDRVLDRARLRHSVPESLSARARLEHRQGVQSDDLLDELDPLHTHRDVGCRGCADACRPRLSGLDVLGVPRAPHR